MRARTWVAAVVLYLLVAVVVTYPLVAQLGTAVPGTPGDAGFYLWCVDTFWTQVRAGASPFHTDRIFVPLGGNLAHASCVPSLALLGAPFLSHLVLYGGLVALASLVVAGLTMMTLVYDLTQDAGAAVVAGLLYGFSPPLLALLAFSQFNETAAAALLPLALLFLLRFLRTAGWGPVAGLSVVMWAIHFTFVYTSAAFLIMAVVVSGVFVRRLRARHVWRGFTVVAINALVLGTLVATLFPPMDMNEIPREGRRYTSRANANLADVVIPSAANPLLGSLHARWASDHNADVASYFVGWGILALGLYAVARRRDAAVVALALAGATLLVLACGSVVRVGGVTLLANEKTPFDWLGRLPFFDLLDAPRRLVVGTALVVAALAGVGLATLAAASSRPRAVLCLGVLLCALEYGQLGMTTTWMVVPSIYRRLAAEPGTRTLLELGGGLAGSNRAFGLDWATPSAHLAYWQTIHRKPRVGGYVSRIPTSTLTWFREAPIMADLLTMVHADAGSWSDRRYTPEEVAAFVRQFDLGYVIIPPYRRRGYYARVVEKLLRGWIERMTVADGYTLYTLRPQ